MPLLTFKFGCFQFGFGTCDGSESLVPAKFKTIGNKTVRYLLNKDKLHP